LRDAAPDLRQQREPISSTKTCLFDYIGKVFAIMSLAPRHTFQVLTKRPARMLEYMTIEGIAGAVAGAADGHGYVINPDELAARWPLSNVWLGVSIENQVAADERIPLLMQTPAEIRFLSCEPLLGPIDFRPLGDSGKRLPVSWLEEGCTGEAIDWVIAGGESGRREQKTRPMRVEWARSLRDQCVAAGVPFLFKQWGDWFPLASADEASWFPKAELTEDYHHVKIGKSRSGRMLDGREWDQYPRQAVA
jgi:protein gp37